MFRARLNQQSENGTARNALYAVHSISDLLRINGITALIVEQGWNEVNGMPDREKVLAWLADEELYYRDHGDTHNSLMACNALELLKEQQELVRCKDCNASHDGALIQEMWCGITGSRILPDDFCSRGKRKET